MIINVEGFDWDAANIGKCEKHGVTIAMVEELFRHDLHILGDLQHSDTEERFIAIGKMSDGRGIFGGFTFRQSKTGRLIRPITARSCTKEKLKNMKKRLPNLNKDSDVERFLDEDLSSYLTAENLMAVTFEFEPKEKVVNLRMSAKLFEKIKKDAQKRKIPYQKYIRQILELAVKQ